MTIIGVEITGYCIVSLEALRISDLFEGLNDEELSSLLVDKDRKSAILTIVTRTL